MIGALTHLVAVAPLHVTMIAVKGTANVLQGHVAVFIFSLKAAELSPNDLGGLLVHFQNDLPGWSQNEFRFQPTVEIFQRNDHGFLAVKL